MRENLFFRWLRAHWAWLVLLAVVVWQFRGFFFGDLVPIPADYLKLVLPGGGAVSNPLLSDVVTQIYPYKQVAFEAWRSGEVPLWNPAIFGGMPFVGAGQGAFFYPLNALAWLFDDVTVQSLIVISQPLIASFGLWLWLRAMKLSRVAALTGALLWAWTGPAMAWQEWGTIGSVLAWLPWGGWAQLRFARTHRAIWLAMAGLGLGLMAVAGHLQVALYGYALLWVYTAWLWYPKGLVARRAAVLALILPFFLGGLLGAVQILPMWEAMGLSFRPLTGWSLGSQTMPLAAWLTGLWPTVFGHPASGDWQGPINFNEISFSIGLGGLFLSGVSLLRWRDSAVRFWWVCALAVGLLVGVPGLKSLFSGFLLGQHLPLRLLSVLTLATCVLAAHGLDHLREGNWRWQRVVPAALLPVTLLVVLGLTGGGAEISAGMAWLKGVAVVVLTWGGGLLLFRHADLRLARMGLLAVLLATVIPVLQLSELHNPMRPAKEVFPADWPLIQTLQEGFAGERLLVAPFNGANLLMPYGLSTTNGYDPVFPARYYQFTQALALQRIEAAPNYNPLALHPLAVDLLGVKGLVFRQAQPEEVLAAHRLQQVTEIDDQHVYANQDAYPRVWLTERCLAGQRDENLRILSEIDLDWRRVATVDQAQLEWCQVLEQTAATDVSSTFETKLVEETKDRLVFEVQSTGPGVMVVNDTYYPGWRAQLNGQPATISPADHLFRGLLIPSAGAYRVEFVYDPWTYKLGFGLSLLGVVLTVGIAVWGRMNPN